MGWNPVPGTTLTNGNSHLDNSHLEQFYQDNSHPGMSGIFPSTDIYHLKTDFNWQFANQLFYQQFWLKNVGAQQLPHILD